MTALRQIELGCPSCGSRFNSHVVAPTTAFDVSPMGVDAPGTSIFGGAKRTDFQEYAGGLQSLPYLVHMCIRCGYSGAERDFTDQTEISPLVREHVWNELSPHVSLDIPASEKYAAAAKVAVWQGADARGVADLWLRAAWCCVDEEDTEAERYYRRYAAWAFERVLAGYDSVPREDRAVIAYLVGELWRRIGDLHKADMWFDHVANEMIDPETQQWIVDAAHRQQIDPQEWFG